MLYKENLQRKEVRQKTLLKNQELLTSTDTQQETSSYPTFQLYADAKEAEKAFPTVKRETSTSFNPVQAFGLDASPYTDKDNRGNLPAYKHTPIQKKQTPNQTGLPDNLKSGIENLSGMSMDDVNVHYNSSKPTQLQAHAYAQGTDIHVASGQEKHLPHEAWHVVQQKQGRVKPTMQMQGVNVNDDKGLEREADVMGGKALQMKGVDNNNTNKEKNARQQVVQRMPTPNAIRETLGKPKMRSSKYKNILIHTNTFHNHVSKTVLADNKAGVIDQLKVLLGMYNRITTALSAYDTEDVNSPKTIYFQKMKLLIQNEKTSTITRMLERSTMNLMAIKNHSGLPLLNSVISRQDFSMLNTDEGSFSREVGGGMSKLRVYGNDEEFFKPNQSELDVFGSMNEENEAGLNLDPTNQEQMKAFSGKQARTEVTEKGKIDTKDTRSKNRELASYRLDQLLNAGLIAKTKIAISTVNQQSTVGSVQIGAGANSKSLGALSSELSNMNDKSEYNRLKNSGKLKQLLNKLQLLDTIALQVDRNQGNMYVRRQGGNVVSITGIDNDMSFGTETGIDKKLQEYPGLARYADKDMANKILNIDIELLKLAMGDLLNEQEIIAMIQRVGKLQDHLKTLQQNNQLLNPNDWTQLNYNAQDYNSSYMKSFAFN